MITFDGAGNITGSEKLVQPDPSPNATTVQAQSFPFAGTYSLNADGSGTLVLRFPDESTIPVSLVVTDGGSGFMFVQTGGGGNNLLTGMARKQ